MSRWHGACSNISSENLMKGYIKMKKLIVFYLEGCPYCLNARRAIAELAAEMPEFSEIELEWINERKEAALADRYDYYRVPSIFCGDKKLYEASPSDSYADIKRHFADAVMTVAGNR